MSDYSRYNFTIKEADLLRVLREADADGYKPLIIINGMYYDLELEPAPSADQGDKIDLLPYELVDGLPF